MRSLYLMSVVLLVLFAGCDKETMTAIPNGKYIGTFIRTTPDARFAPSKVTLTIDNNKFSGTSETPRYPAICSGSLKVDGNKLTVNNDCMFTADFDWSYIFQGDYTIELSGNQLKITRSYPNSVYDQYVFEKQ